MKLKVSFNKGFTLLEILIATSILALVMLVGSYSYSIFGKGWNKQNSRIQVIQDQVRLVNTLDRLMESIIPFIVVHEGKQTFLFEGSSTRLIAVANQGLIDSENPVVFQLSMVAGARDSFRLVYEEAPFSFSFKTLNEIEFPEQLILYAENVNLKLSYLGWESLSIKQNSQFQSNTENVNWFGDYSGVIRRLHPEEIKLTLNINSSIVELVNVYNRKSEERLNENEL